jgi:hypothetical protein
MGISCQKSGANTVGKHYGVYGKKCARGHMGGQKVSAYFAHMAILVCHCPQTRVGHSVHEQESLE